MKKCKYCGRDIFQERDSDGTYEESYCNKFCRKDHEKQLIKEGKLEGMNNVGFGVLKNTKYRDIKGEKIWFPKDEKPYYDRALQKTFHTIQEKHEYMKKNNLVMDGSSDSINRHRIPEAGDTRQRVR